MPQPTPYDRQNSFTTLASTNPSAPYTGADLDEEFNAVKVTLDELMANIALVQRDDGELGNQTVGPDQLAASLSIGINPPSAWVTAVAYGLYDTVFDGTILYKALEAHTSGAAFATDLAALKWEQLAEFNTVAVADGEITTAKLADLAVTSGKIASDAVTTNKILDAAVTTAKIADGAITAVKLGASAVSTAKIQDAAITTAKLADASLIAIGALTPATDKIAYFTDATTAALATITAAGRALLDDADAATMRATLGLGTAAVLDVGTTANKVVQLTAAAKLPAVDGSLLTGIQTGSVDYQVFTANGTWTKPSGVTASSMARIQIWGSGGGGGANATGGGGGGGGCREIWKLVSALGSTESVVIASGGAVNTAGGTSSFGSHGSAFGGGRGTDAADGGGGGGGGAQSVGSNGSAANGGNGGLGGGGGTDGGNSGGTGNHGGGGADGGFNGGVGGAGVDGGGGGGGYGSVSSSNGGDSVNGGGGGGGGKSGSIGGRSSNGGAGGAINVAGSAPAGGGGRNAAGARGEVRVTVFR